LTVVIPVGAEEGMTLRIPNQGMPSHEPVTPSGDLLIIVRTASDLRFQRRGTDLWYGEVIDDVAAALGCEIEIPTLETSVKVVVPPGTQSDEVLRLAGKGLPQFGGGKRGGLMVRVQVRIPDKLMIEERRLYEQLRDERRNRQADKSQMTS
jgi:DnaJ-class molecular chaperone